MATLQSARNKEPERYYLFAGMGGHAARRKHKVMLQWAIFTGILVSLGLAGLMCFINHYWR